MKNSLEMRIYLPDGWVDSGNDPPPPEGVLVSGPKTVLLYDDTGRELLVLVITLAPTFLELARSEVGKAAATAVEALLKWLGHKFQKDKDRIRISVDHAEVVFEPGQIAKAIVDGLKIDKR